MPSMPIDVSKLLSAITNIGQQRDMPSRVELVFDPTASDALVDKVIDAFVDVSSNAHVTDTVLSEKVPALSKDTDLVVIVGGDSLLLGDVAHAAEEIGVPAVVVIERGKTYFANDRGSAQAYADMTLAANSAPTLTGTAQAPGVGRGIDLEDLVDIELDGDAPRPLEQLGTWVVQNVPDKRLSLARAFPFMRHPLAVELAKQTTIQNGAIGLVFFVPGADMPLIALNQAKMVLQIAAVYGKEMNRDRIARSCRDGGRLWLPCGGTPTRRRAPVLGLGHQAGRCRIGDDGDGHCRDRVLRGARQTARSVRSRRPRPRRRRLPSSTRVPIWSAPS